MTDENKRFTGTDRDELRLLVADVFANSGWVAADTWSDVWPWGYYLRVCLEPLKRRPDCDVAIERAYRLRKRMDKETGLPWVVVVYDPGMSLQQKQGVIARMAGRASW
jgi:hypothetical protein